MDGLQFAHCTGCRNRCLCPVALSQECQCTPRIWLGARDAESRDVPSRLAYHVREKGFCITALHREELGDVDNILLGQAQLLLQHLPVPVDAFLVRGIGETVGTPRARKEQGPLRLSATGKTLYSTAITTS